MHIDVLFDFCQKSRNSFSILFCKKPITVKIETLIRINTFLRFLLLSGNIEKITTSILFFWIFELYYMSQSIWISNVYIWSNIFYIMATKPQPSGVCLNNIDEQRQVHATLVWTKYVCVGSNHWIQVPPWMGALILENQCL